MIDLATEELVPLVDVPGLKMFARRPPSDRAVRRWATAGLKGHKLETVKRGGTRCTTLLALERFFERLSEPSLPASTPTPSERARAQSRAAAILDRAGI
jgi:hypothetical protein